MDSLIANFFKIVDEFKQKPYDLLDFSKNTFDRDFLEYNVSISDLETALQGFINQCFENIPSTQQALNLLRQFESILQRDSLKSDLESKYAMHLCMYTCFHQQYTCFSQVLSDLS